MTTFDVRSRRSSIYAAAAAEKITLRLHRGLPPPASGYATRCCRLSGSPNGLVRIHPSVRPYVRPEEGDGVRRGLARRSHAAHAYFVHEVQFGFMKTLIAALLVNRAFSSARRTASEIAVRFLLQN